jgi:hypothetical protein
LFACLILSPFSINYLLSIFFSSNYYEWKGPHCYLVGFPYTTSLSKIYTRVTWSRDSKFNLIFQKWKGKRSDSEIESCRNPFHKDGVFFYIKKMELSPKIRVFFFCKFSIQFNLPFTCGDSIYMYRLFFFDQKRMETKSNHPKIYIYILREWTSYNWRGHKPKAPKDPIEPLNIRNSKIRYS